MDRGAVIAALSAGGYFRGSWTLDDETHDALSVTFVEEAFEDWVHSLPNILRTVRDIGGGKTRLVPRWIAEVYDCDNLARSFANFLDEALAVDAASGGRTRGNPAAGKFNFTLDSGGGHARVWFVDMFGNVRSFDPGIGELVTESATEKASIFAGETI